MTSPTRSRSRPSRPRTSPSCGAARAGGATSSTTRSRSSSRARARCWRTWRACCASAARCCASCAGDSTPRPTPTLDVWDERLAALGDDLAARRGALARALDPEVAELYRALADETVDVGVAYAPSWSGSLADALAAARGDDVRRAVSTVGPHRDDVALTIDGRDARTQSSQGEQRSLALALRIAVHERVTRTRGPPAAAAARRRLLRARRRPRGAAPRAPAASARRCSRRRCRRPRACTTPTWSTSRSCTVARELTATGHGRCPSRCAGSRPRSCASTSWASRGSRPPGRRCARASASGAVPVGSATAS